MFPIPVLRVSMEYLNTHYKMATHRQILVVGPGHRLTHPHHHVWWMHYCNTVQEHSPVVCFTESSGEQGLTVGVERRVVSDNAATDGGR